jgi:hypothetical protein
VVVFMTPQWLSRGQPPSGIDPDGTLAFTLGRW